MPTDRGALRAACPDCAHQFEWAPDEPVEAAAEPVARAKPAPRRRIFWLLNFLACFAAVCTVSLFGLFTGELPGFMNIALTLGAFFLFFWFYRSFRGFTGSNIFLSVIAAMMAPFLATQSGKALNAYFDSGDFGAVLANVAGDDAAMSEPSPFRGLNAKNTTASDLDAVMEDW